MRCEAPDVMGSSQKETDTLDCKWDTLQNQTWQSEISTKWRFHWGKKPPSMRYTLLGMCSIAMLKETSAIPEETLKQRGHVLQKFRLSPSLQLQCPMRKKDKPIVYLKLIRPAATNKQLNQRLKEKTRWGNIRKCWFKVKTIPWDFLSKMRIRTP